MNRTTMTGAFRTDAGQTTLDRLAAIYSPSAPHGGRVCPRVSGGFATIHGIMIRADGHGNATWTAVVEAGRAQNGRPYPNDRATATPEMISEALRLDLRLIQRNA
jgi:hypothetical protein